MQKRLILLIGLLSKLAILVVYGPFATQDTNGYIRIADAILSDPSFFAKVPDWASAALPLFAFRPIGYPLVIALAEKLAGVDFRYVLVALQIALSVVIAAFLFDLTALLTKSTRWAMLATLLYFLSGTALWDNDILCDSLYASLFNIVILQLVLRLLRHQEQPKHRLFLFGVLWGASILLRDNGIYFTAIPILILLVQNRLDSQSTRKILVQSAAFGLPVLLIVISCAGWNLYRTGSAFISVTSVANYLHPAFDIERFGYADPFDGDSVLDRTVKSTMHSYDYSEQPGLLQNVHDALHLTSPIQLQKLILAKFIYTVAHFPIAYARYVGDNLNPLAIGDALFDPLLSYNDFYQLGAPPHQRLIPGLSLKTLRALVHAHRYAAVLLAVLAGLLRAAAGAIWLLTLLGVPYIFWERHRRRQSPTPELAASGLMLATVVAVAGLFALIHLEMRYLLVITPEALAAAAFMGHSVLTLWLGKSAPNDG
jgi:hypothetical protein